MTKHNKKRNIGIMYELLLRHISSKLIEGDKDAAKVATSIIEKRFDKQTELYKEFRLFNALANSSVTDTAVAAAILTEAKHAVNRFNVEKLEKEKSRLIKDINHKLKDAKFYYRSIPNYREYANIHNMMKEWQKADKSNLKEAVLLEQKALTHLLSEKNETSIEKVKNSFESQDANVLIEKIMTEKINKKYANFSNSQRQILQKYAIYSNDKSNHEKLKLYLNEKKSHVLTKLSRFGKTNKNAYLDDKIKMVEGKIKSLDVEVLDDTTISRFLTLTKLVEEFNTGE